MPRVSVIIPAYNTAAYLADALNSVLSQTYSDWEVVLVDDGSTDGTRSLVESMMPAFDGRLTYIYQANRGLPAARNTAIRAAKGEFLALLDADDVWLSHHTQRLVDALDANPDAGLVHAKVARINTKGQVIEYPPAPQEKLLSGRIADHIYTRRAHILCPTTMMRRKALDKAGLFDEQMRATEDRDLWFRIAKHYEVAYVPEILSYYRISSNSMSRDWERMRKAQLFFIDKHLKSGACTRLAARRAVGNLYRERGDALFHTSLRESIDWYAKSVIVYPLSGRNVYMLGRALAEPLLARLKSRPDGINPAAPAR